MKIFIQSRSKMLVFKRIHQKQNTKTLFKAGPSNIPWDPIDTK